MKTPYNLSKDYGLLYNLLCEGYIAACFVDYSFTNDDSKPSRDICKCRRFKKYDIQIGVRGIQYGGVDQWDNEKGSEKELFTEECASLNLEWIKPKIDYIASVDPALGNDIATIIEAIKDIDDKICIVSGIPKGAFVKSEAIERLKEMPVPVVTPKEGLFFVDQKGKRTNHERKPSKYGKK